MLRRIFADKEGHIAIIEWPNAPLIIWLLALAASKISSGSVANIFAVISTIAILVWALLELLSGRSLFRRVLGGLILATVLWRIFTS